MLKEDAFGLAYTNIIMACGIFFSVCVFLALKSGLYFYLQSAIVFLLIFFCFISIIKKAAHNRYNHTSVKSSFMKRFRYILLDIVNSCAFTNFSVTTFFIAQADNASKGMIVILEIMAYLSLLVWAICTILYTRYGLQRRHDFSERGY